MVVSLVASKITLPSLTQKLGPSFDGLIIAFQFHYYHELSRENCAFLFEKRTTRQVIRYGASCFVTSTKNIYGELI